MAFLALKPMDVAGSMRMVGDLVPEAATWVNLHVWAKQGYVVQVSDDLVEEYVAGLRAGKSVQHITPTARPHHLAIASRHLQHGAAVAEALPPPTSAAPAAPAAHVEAHVADHAAKSPAKTKAKPHPQHHRKG